MVELLDTPDQSYYDDGTNRLDTIIAAINGYAGQGIQFDLVEYSNDNDFGTKHRNTGLDGLHWACYLSTSDPKTDAPIVEVEDIGLIVASADFRVYDGTNVVLLVNSTGVTIGSGYSLTLPDDLAVVRDLTVGRDAHIGRDEYVAGGLAVGLNAAITGNASAGGSLSAGTTLTVGDDAQINGDLTVDGINVLYTSSAGNALDVKNTNSSGFTLVARRSDTNAALIVPANTGIVSAPFGLTTAGDLIVVNIAASGTIAATVDVTAGGSISTTHAVTAGTNITATAGNITASAGNIVATAGSVSSGTSISATTSMTAGTNITATAGTITAGSTVQGTRLISTVGTGTAPLTVTSTTLVSNLNANFLNGLTTGNGSGNIPVSNGSTNANLIAQYLSSTGRDATYLLDRTNHTNTQLSATISDLAATVATLNAATVGSPPKIGGTGSGNLAILDAFSRVQDSELLTGLAPSAIGAAGTVAVTDGSGRVYDSTRLNSTVSGNASGNTPVSNGTLNTNLVSQYVGASGQDAAYLLLRTNHTGTAPANSITQGSGSTLDADTVDGSHASAFATTTALTTHESSADHDARYLRLAGGTVVGGSAFSSTLDIAGNFSVSTNGFAVNASTNKTRVNASAVHGSYDLSVGSNGIYTAGAIEAGGNAILNGGTVTTGNLAHVGTTAGFFGSTPQSKQTVTGSRGGNVALASLLSTLANYGILTDSST